MPQAVPIADVAHRSEVVAAVKELEAFLANHTANQPYPGFIAIAVYDQVRVVFILPSISLSCNTVIFNSQLVYAVNSGVFLLFLSERVTKNC